jgi:5-methylcytosine-specific restriction protein A
MALKALKPRLTPVSTKAYGDNHQPKSRWGKSRGHEWTKLRRVVLERDKFTCQHCHRVGGNLECDHKVNEAQGGTNELSNLQTLCRECHKVKTQQESIDGMFGKVID